MQHTRYANRDRAVEALANLLPCLPKSLLPIYLTEDEDGVAVDQSRLIRDAVKFSQSQFPGSRSRYF